MAGVMGTTPWDGKLRGDNAVAGIAGAMHFIQRWREYTPGRSTKQVKFQRQLQKRKKARRPRRPPGIFIPNDLLQRSASRSQYLPEHTGFRQRRDLRLIIAERVAQHLSGVLAEQWRGHGVDDRRQRKIERGFDIRNGTGLGVRNLADAMTVARLGRVEGFLDGAQVTDGDIGRLHPGYPILAGVLRKKTGKDHAQLVLVGGARTAITKFAADKIGTSEHLDDKTAI